MSQFKITSTAASLELGNTTFNSQIGLDTGTIYALEGNVDNDWDTEHSAYFTAISDDPALYNILVADDSDFEIESSGAVVTKFWGWNILQDLTTIMMTSIEHRNVPQNTPVTSKRPLLGIVRLRLAMRVA